MRRRVALLVAVVAVLSLPRGAGAGIGEDLTVTISQASTEVLLGDTFDVRIDVTNTGAAPTSSLVVHIDITDPTSAESVDPEDWTSTLSKPIGALGSGESTHVEWQLQPISPGRFTLYAVSLSAAEDTTAISNVVTVDVTDRRTLNPEGILPVAIGVPLLIGGLLALQIGRTRRAGRSSSQPG